MSNMHPRQISSTPKKLILGMILCYQCVVNFVKERHWLENVIGWRTVLIEERHWLRNVIVWRTSLIGERHWLKNVIEWSTSLFQERHWLENVIDWRTWLSFNAINCTFVKQGWPTLLWTIYSPYLIIDCCCCCCFFHFFFSMQYWFCVNIMSYVCLMSK